jgi:hypothetical protein
VEAALVIDCGAGRGTGHGSKTARWTSSADMHSRALAGAPVCISALAW